jgi:hypothetical protein
LAAKSLGCPPDWAGARRFSIVETQSSWLVLQGFDTANLTRQRRCSTCRCELQNELPLSGAPSIGWRGPERHLRVEGGRCPVDQPTTAVGASWARHFVPLGCGMGSHPVGSAQPEMARGQALSQIGGNLNHSRGSSTSRSSGCSGTSRSSAPATACKGRRNTALQGSSATGVVLATKAGFVAIIPSKMAC